MKQTAGIQDRKVLLQNAAYTYRRCASENAALYEIVTNHPLELEDSDFIPIIQDLDAFYNKVLAPFGLNQDEMIHAARMFNSTLHGFVLAEKPKIRLPNEESWNWARKLYLNWSVKESVKQLNK